MGGLDQFAKSTMAQQFGMFSDNSGPPVMAACGMGVDSVAMIIEWLAQGRRLDLVLFADTGAEKSATYAFIPTFAAWLKAKGIAFHIVRYQPKDFKNYPAYRSLLENSISNQTLPSVSFGFGSCSIKWKAAPQHTFAKAWAPAVEAWANGGKVIKLIGYDCGKADQRRYAEREGYEDSAYEFVYPLREWGWKREDCAARIVAEGLPLPVKSSCFFCCATKPHELHDYTVAELRLIVLMEARAMPRLTKIEGLWRKSVKGCRGATPRPGDMTTYIRDQGLLPAEEVQDIIDLAPAALVAFQAANMSTDGKPVAELGDWVRLFAMRDSGAFDIAGQPRLYEQIASATDAKEAA